VSDQIQQAARLVIEATLNQNPTPAAIALALDAAGLLQAATRPAGIADQAEVRQLREDLAQEIAAHALTRQLAEVAENDRTELAAYRLWDTQQAAGVPGVWS